VDSLQGLLPPSLRFQQQLHTHSPANADYGKHRQIFFQQSAVVDKGMDVAEVLGIIAVGDTMRPSTLGKRVRCF
jgi:hypothetical protein